jgi:hypothetical protein
MIVTHSRNNAPARMERLERMRSEYAPSRDEAGKSPAARHDHVYPRDRLRDLSPSARKRPQFVELGEVARDRPRLSSDQKPDSALAGVVGGVRHAGRDRMGLARREPDRWMQSIGPSLEDLQVAFEHVKPRRAGMTLRGGSAAVGRDDLDQVERREGICAGQERHVIPGRDCVHLGGASCAGGRAGGAGN